MNTLDSGNRTIDRIAAILNCFSEQTSEQTLTQICSQIGLPKSTTHRLLESMEKQGIVNFQPINRSYQLGFQVIRWGYLAQTSFNLRKTALPILQSLRDETGETSYLVARSGNFGIFLEIIQSIHAVHWAMQVGRSQPLHAGASCRTILSFLPQDEIDAILNDNSLISIGPHTITDIQVLKKEIKKTQELGYAVSIEEIDEGAIGISAPVYNHLNTSIASIGIGAPSERMPPQNIAVVVQKVLTASKKLSRQLGSSIT